MDVRVASPTAAWDGITLRVPRGEVQPGGSDAPPHWEGAPSWRVASQPNVTPAPLVGTAK